MHDFIFEMERGRRKRLLEAARANRMKKSLRERNSDARESKITAFAKEFGRDAKAVASRLRGNLTEGKETQ